MIIFIYHQSVNKANNNRNPSVKFALYKLFLLFSWHCLVTKQCPNLLQPHGLLPARLLCPWNFPGKNTGAGCNFLLKGNLPDLGIEPASPALAGRFFTAQPPWQSMLFKHHQFWDISLYYSYSFIHQIQKFLTPQMSCPCNLILLISSKSGYLSQGQSMLRKELVAHTDVLFPDKL